MADGSMRAVPPGGWTILERGCTLEGTSHDDLVATLADYRTANSLPLGDPAAEVDQSICKRWPNLCGGGFKASTVDADLPPQAYGRPVVRPLAERVSSWASNRFSRLGTVAHVEEDEAERRTTICVACPNNVATWKRDATKDCPPCQEKINQLEALLFKVKKGNKTSRDKLLGACAASGQCNATAVWLDAKQLSHARHYSNDLHSSCWMRELNRDIAGSTI